jgi:hypothetical protein
VKGLPMLSYEGQFYYSHHREPSVKSNAVFPIKKPTHTQGRSNSFVNDIRPMFETYRLLGQFPLHMKDSGSNIYHPDRKANSHLIGHEIPLVLWNLNVCRCVKKCRSLYVSWDK